ncbi:MAG: ABC transporter ATP-binding protein [Acidovorax sp.]
MNLLELHDLATGYDPARPTVTGLDLTVRRGELISLLGPSGCGKTTTMRAIAGLLPLRAGRIVLDGADIGRTPTHKRNIGLVFQSYALFPHLSVFENVAFGLRLRKTDDAEIGQRAEAVLKAVGLTGFERRLPAQLSGGQQQRVALARAIVVEPKLLLLDEPLSNLDAKLRVQMRAELRRIQRELGMTMLYVTHDQDEALALSDRIVVMNGGRIEQLDVPEVLFNRPCNRFVAQFMGFENLFAYRDGALHGEGGSAPFDAAVPVGTASIGWRVDQVRVGEGALQGVAKARNYLGDRVEYLIESPLGAVKGMCEAAAARWQEGEAVQFALPPAAAVFLPD